MQPLVYNLDPRASGWGFWLSGGKLKARLWVKSLEEGLQRVRTNRRGEAAVVLVRDATSQIAAKYEFPAECQSVEIHRTPLEQRTRE